MDQLPALTGIFFVLTTLLTILIFHGAAFFSKTVLRVLLIWMLFQAVVALTGFYKVSDYMLLRFSFQIVPVLLLLFLLFTTTKGKLFLDNLDIPALTVFHIIRIPVELVFFWLFFYDNTSAISIFELRNLDLLTGISAPIMMYFVFIKNTLNKKVLLIWNCISLVLLLNVVIHAVIAAPLPFAYITSHQPNVAILYFPFIWMSCCIVPLVLLAHLAVIRQLIQVEINKPALA